MPPSAPSSVSPSRQMRLAGRSLLRWRILRRNRPCHSPRGRIRRGVCARVHRRCRWCRSRDGRPARAPLRAPCRRSGRPCCGCPCRPRTSIPPERRRWRRSAGMQGCRWRPPRASLWGCCPIREDSAATSPGLCGCPAGRRRRCLCRGCWMRRGSAGRTSP